MSSPQATFQVNTESDLHKVVSWLLVHFPQGALVGLSGELGAGKTTFVRKLIETLAGPGKSPRVTSPTYVIHQRYDVGRPVHHYDLYRLENLTPQSLTDLQYEDFLEEIQRYKGFILIEWWERAQSIGLKPQVVLHFTITGEYARLVIAKPAP